MNEWWWSNWYRTFKRIFNKEAIVERDQIILFGQVVKRPARMAPSQWLEFLDVK